MDIFSDCIKLWTVDKIWTVQSLLESVLLENFKIELERIGINILDLRLGTHKVDIFRLITAE